MFRYRTAFFCLGLLASTRRGACLLSDFGWESVRHKHHEVWAVAEDPEEECAPVGLSGSLSNVSLSSMDPQGFVNVPAVTTQGSAQGSPKITGSSPKASFLLGGSDTSKSRSNTANSASTTGLSFQDLSIQSNCDDVDSVHDGVKANGDVKVLSSSSNTLEIKNELNVVHLRSKSDPANKSESDSGVPSEGMANHLLRRPRERLHLGKPTPREERSSSNESSQKSRCESFDTNTSGVSSCESAPPSHAEAAGTHLTPIPSASSVSTNPTHPETDLHQPLVHPSDIYRKLANLRQVPGLRRRYSNPVLGHISPHNAMDYIQNPHTENNPVVMTSPRDLAGYARLRQLQQHRALSVDLEADSHVPRLLWNPPSEILRHGSSAQEFSSSQQPQRRSIPFSTKARYTHSSPLSYPMDSVRFLILTAHIL